PPPIPISSLAQLRGKKGISSHVRTRQGREGARQGRRQAPPEGSPRQHSGHHQAGDPAPGEERRREANLRAHLRGDPRRPQDLPRERHPRRRHLHRARTPQDRHCHGRRLRPQAPGPHPLRLRRLIRCPDSTPACSVLMFVPPCSRVLRSRNRRWNHIV
ncbi:hypothetical protein BRADI_2g22787v3, partial [Brachypodium distachyon]